MFDPLLCDHNYSSLTVCLLGCAAQGCEVAGAVACVCETEVDTAAVFNDDVPTVEELRSVII